MTISFFSRHEKEKNGQCHLSSKHTIFTLLVLNILNKQKSDIPDLNRRISEQEKGFFQTNNTRNRKRRKCEKKRKKYRIAF